MSKEEKNKPEGNIWVKQGIFFGIIVLWLLAIVLKNQMSLLVAAIVFLFLLLLTLAYGYWLNRSFFGKKDKK